MRRLVLSFFILSAWILSGCAKQAGEQAARSMETNPLADSLVITDSLLKGFHNKNIAHESFLRAINYRNLGKLDVAIPFYKRALAHDPQSRFLAFELAGLLADEDQPQDALKIALQGLQIPGDTTASESYLLARLYRENNQIIPCREWYERTIKINPSHLRALYEYSVILEISQDYKNLLRIYDLLLPLLNYPEPMVKKQKLLLKLKGDNSTLIDFMEKAFEHQPSQELGQELIGALMEAREYRRVFAIGQTLLRLDSTDLETQRLLVRASLKMNDLNQAIELQRNLWLQDSSHYDELQRLAMIEFEAGQRDSSYAHFQQMVELRSNDHLSWFYLSNLANLRGDTAQAMNFIEKATALKPNALAYRNQQAALYSLRQEYDKAHKVLNEALTLQPDNALGMQFKAGIYLSEASWLESQWPAPQSAKAQKARQARLNALTWLTKAHAIDSVSVEILFDLASNYERLDSVQQSIQYFQTLLKLEPHYHQALNYYGYMLVDRKIDVNKGAALIDSAIVNSNPNEAYLDSKAWAFYRLKKWDDARKILEYLVNEMNSKDVVIWEHLAWVAEAQKDTKRAQEAWSFVQKHRPNHPHRQTQSAEKP